MAWHVVGACLLLAAAMARCTSESMGGPAGGKSVSNNPGSFSYAVGGLLDANDRYAWQDPAPRATVEFSAGGTGTVTVALQDSMGKSVLSRTFRRDGGSASTATSSAGAPGEWTIRIDAKGAGGFTVQVRAG